MSQARSRSAGVASPVLPPGFLEAVERRVGARGLSIDPERIGPHAAEPWGTARGHSPLLLRPATTAEVAALLELCHAEGVPVVPQGGNTGLVGAGVPDASGRLAILSLGRLNRIRALDPLNDTITVEAGCVLESVQQAAAEVDRLFPLALGAQGSCQIGGNLSSNAGGINVLRYGMARALVLGLEVVLADGRIWDGLRALRKDNTGYDLKQMFIGAEGTLGVITAAVLRLLPQPRERQTAWLGVASPKAAVALLGLMRERLGETVSSFELLSGGCVELVLRYLPGTRAPLARAAPWYVLAEVAWSLADGLGAELERVLEEALARGLIADGVIAKSEAERRALWALRENPTEAMAREGLVLRHDIAVPVSRVPELIEQGAAALATTLPGVRIIPFGHLGDGNIHYNLLQPAGMSGDDFRARAEPVQRLVFDVVAGLGGSISAEHGIGRLKRAELAARKPPVELALMRSLKAVLDPKGILNPGAVL
jgi:FAD/FMN-containing dehydrogenase